MRTKPLIGRNFVALDENRTMVDRNFVAQHKLCLNATVSLWVRIEIAGNRYVVALPGNQTHGFSKS